LLFFGALPRIREGIHDQSGDHLISGKTGVNAFEALPLSGSVARCRSFAEEDVKANSVYRGLF
jgi:hypothetical protein